MSGRPTRPPQAGRLPHYDRSMRAWLTLPNLFTLARLLLAPIVVYAIVNRRAFAALSIFAVAAATDIIDGYLARHFGAATAAGAFLDPIADKVAADRGFPGAGAGRAMPWWLVGVIFGRDLFILAASLPWRFRRPNCVRFHPVRGARLVLFFRS